jgi:hypothetical protein
MQTVAHPESALSKATWTDQDLDAMSWNLCQIPAVGPVVPHDETGWHLEGRDFDLRFTAWRFTLHLRRPPLYGRRVLRMADRGGISFEARSFA